MPPHMTQIIDSRVVRRGYVTISAVTLRGDDGVVSEREVADHGASVCILPYDPYRRLALMVRMPRAPVLASGQTEQLLEAPAGMVDPGETAEQSARRELMEEVGLAAKSLEPVAVAWPSPGVSSERSSLFLAPYAKSDRTGAGGGAPGENEAITVEETPLAQLWTLAQAGGLVDLKTLALVLTLWSRRPELFA